MAGSFADNELSLERYALVVCDMQPDLLRSISDEARAELLDALRICIEGARTAGWFVVFTGLRFPKGYAGVSARDRLYGGLQRLNAKMGDEQVHWFMEGYAGSEIEPSLGRQDGDAVVWRQKHVCGDELLDTLRARGITKVVVTGLKAGYAVQATCQALCNEGMMVYVVRECVQDDVPERLAAVLDHVLPVYADVIACEDFLQGIGVDTSIEAQRDKSANDACQSASQGKYFFCTDCKRGGHGQRFCEYLLERPNWRACPEQKWYQDERWKEYYCPLGKKVVDFADEPQFSRIAMYLSGRAWLEEKIKVVDIAEDYMAHTFVAEDGQWIGKAPPPDCEARKAPWFVKAADRNWGSNVHCCLYPSECMALTKPGSRYVVQQHILDPLLMDDGRKCHIKFYILLMCAEDGINWSLYTYKDGFLSISPNKWSADDISSETQVTIIRSERLSTVEGWGAWPEAYPKCKYAVSTIVNRAIQKGKLEGRLGKKQFEIFSADFIVDTSMDVWMFEFNFDPVLRDEAFSPTVNDAAMVRSALSIVMPWEHGSPGLWDHAGDFCGAPPGK